MRCCVFQISFLLKCSAYIMSTSKSSRTLDDREIWANIFLTHREILINELQKEVPLFLFEKKVLTKEEYDIAKKFERKNQIIYVLDCLPAKSPEQRKVFTNYVMKEYSWFFHMRNEAMNAYDEDFREILERGEIPALPSKYVKRMEEFIELCDLLSSLKRNEYVVVFGMRGCGKSTLVSHVLYQSNSLIIDAFKKNVFWISAGCNHPTDDLALQQELYLKVSPSFHYNNNRLPLDSKNAKIVLKECFRKDELKDCLLILDDVSSVSTVKAFDICCKILITTDDKYVMKTTKKPVRFVKVSEGFTEAESLDLLCKSIGCEKLPAQAKSLHSLCKGFPLTVSLISSQLAEFKEDVLVNPDRWNECLKRLKEGGISAAIGHFDHNRQEQVTYLYRALKMSIDSLQPRFRQYYQDFALFMNDVNISPEVLCILWEMCHKKDVEDLMTELERKCLVVKTWNRIKKSYVYSIHDLLLEYLKNQLTPEETLELHQKLIKSYKKKYGSDYNNFPTDDNYILLYLGYHLKEANYLDEFPKAFLNLLFVEKKIMNSGAADLLYDFRKYKSSIIKGPDLMKTYEDFMYFITRVAACKTISNSDLIQFALCESKESSVYKAAIQLKSNKEKSHLAPKYFDILTEAPTEDCAPFVYNHNENIVASALLINKDVLIANSDGVIRRVDMLDHRTTRTFEGHLGKITSIHVSKTCMYFLSTSDDSTVRIWNANGSASSDVPYEKPRTPSPALKQKDWMNPFPRQKNTGEAPLCILDQHSLPIKDAKFGNNYLYVVSTAADYKMIIWSLAVDTLGDYKIYPTSTVLIDTEDIIESCNFSNDDTKVFCAAQKGKIYIYERTGTLLATTTNQFEIKSMIVIPDPSVEIMIKRGFRDVISDTVLLLGKIYFSVLDKLDQPENFDLNKKPNIAPENKRQDENICAAVSWNGKYIAIASTNYSIRIYDTLNGTKVMRLNECNGRIHSLCWSKQNNMLLASYNSQVLKMWNVQIEGITNYPAKLRHDLFEAVWIINNDEGDSDDNEVFVSAVIDNNNNINVFYNLATNGKIENESSSEIHQICMLPDGNVVYACKDGRVYLLDLDAQERPRLILNVKCVRIIKLKVFHTSNQVLVVLLVKNEAREFSIQAWLQEKTTQKNIETTNQLVNMPTVGIYDFVINLENQTLLLIRDNNLLRIYDYPTCSLKYSEEFDLKVHLDSVKFADISHNFLFIATGNEHQLFIRKSNGQDPNYLEWKDSVLKVCKFSPDEKYVAVGFADGDVKVYDLKVITKHPNNNVEKPYKFPTGPVIDISWSSTSTKFIVIFDREISLYEQNEATGRFKVASILYISVDKLICSPSFSRCVTVDSSGHFRVLKLPS